MKKITLLCLIFFGFISKSFGQLSQDFEGTFPPTDWTIESTNAEKTWQQASGGINGASAFVPWDYDQNESLISPTFTVPAAAALTFKLQMSYNWGVDPNNNYDLNILVSTDGGAVWTPIWNESQLGVFTSFVTQNVLIDFSAYAGQTDVKIKFQYVGSDGADLAIDDVLVDTAVEAPSCASNPTPADLATNVPVGAITLSWDAPTTGGAATEYDLYAGETAETVTSLVGTYTDTNTATDLVINNYNVTVYWKIVPKNLGGQATGCPVWSFTTEASQGYCLTAPNGQWPSATYTPATCDGLTINSIATNCYAGEFSKVTVTAGQTYTFYSSNTTTNDFITISADAGVTAAAYGASPLTWVATVSGDIQFYSHLDDQCASESVSRTRAIVCGIPSTDSPDYANLQWPASITVTQGNSGTVYGQIYEAGLTDVAPNIAGQAPGVNAWVGISLDNSNPNTWTNWTAMTWNDQHTSNNDEYMVNIGSALPPGTYYYATRYSLNNGGYVYGGYSTTGGGFWDGTSNVSGTLVIQDPVQPTNDDCAGAIALNLDEATCNGTNTNGSNLGATDSGLDPATCFENGQNDVWFSFTVPANVATVDVSTDFLGGSLNDTEIAVYSGSCGSLTEVGCDQDSGTTTLENGFAYNSVITNLAVNAGETYYVRVAGYSNDDAGSFCLKIATNQLLANDQFDFTNLMVYPNPTKNVLNVSFTAEINKIELFNILGQTVLTKDLNATASQLDLSGLTSGAYFVKVTAGENSKTIKIIKE